MIETIKFKVNDKPVSLKIDSDRMLLWVLRTDLGLPGTKYGCGEGNPDPSEADIISNMDANLGRCGAHIRIIKAIQNAAAIANAIFNATGARLYQMPMTPARVKEAIQSQHNFQKQDS